MSNRDEKEMAQYTRREFLALAGMGAVLAGTTAYIGWPVFNEILEGVPPIPTGEESWATAVCQICPSGCSLDVRRIGERVVKVEGNPRHRLNHGKVCPKAHANTQVLYDPDRLQGPKQRVGDHWEDITWEQAMTRLTEELGSLQANDEAHSLLFLRGSAPGHMFDLTNRFSQAYGSPNVASHGSQCVNAEKAANLLTRGWYDKSAYDWEKVKQVLFFGGSFLEDWQPQLQMLGAYSFIRRGRPFERGRITQVSSRASVSALKADEWVPVKPGMEGALALGLTHVIIKENQLSWNFINDHTTGFDEFSELVLNEYSPETISGITGIPTETIKRLARELADGRPAIAAAGHGLGIGTNAMYNITAINALNAVLGNIDVEGGVLKQQYPPFTEWPKITPVEQPRLDGAGGIKHPLASCAYHELPDHILSGDPYPIKAMFVYDSNPLFDSPGTSRWREALDKIPFIVSFSPFLDETAGYADLLLPDHTYLERIIDVVPPAGMGRAMVSLSGPVVQPLYDTRHTGDVLLELAQKLGGSLTETLPWQNYEELLKFRYEGIFQNGKGSIQASSFDEFWTELLKRGVWEGPRYKYENWDEAFTTPSGTFEFKMTHLATTLNNLTESTVEEEGMLSAQSAEFLSTIGISASKEVALLPHYEPPNVAGEPEDYPLMLVPFTILPDAGNRAPNAPALWNIYGLLLKEPWGNWAGLNTETATRLGIHDGDMVWVESPEGKIKLKARLYKGAMPDVVDIPLGGGHTAGGRWASAVRGANPTEIVVPQSDPIAGSAAWLGTRVKVYKA